MTKPDLQQWAENGFGLIDDVYSDDEIQRIAEKIEYADPSRPSFRKTNDLFAIRRFLQEVPDIGPLIFTDKFNKLLRQCFGSDHFPVRSIYFDKPGGSNWFVAYHQDLTISVNKRVVWPDFNSWTIKQGQHAVQPPVEILENIFTARIHLDDTDKNNGALKVIPGSHKNGVVRQELIHREKEVICEVKRGGVMIMKPLLLHASSRSIDPRNRRVIHIEFSNRSLPAGLEWA